MAASKPMSPGLVIDKVPDCPICLELLAAPIYQCKSGHDICGSCSDSLRPFICPICRRPMTRTRNEGLEMVIMEAKVSCPNKDAGCVYNMQAKYIDDHLKECIFRNYTCPMEQSGYGHAKCSWMGKRTDMMNHFKKRHANHCNIKPDTNTELNYLKLTLNNGHLYLASHDKLLFVINLKKDTAKGLAYITVQHIGTKGIAHQHNYTIEVISKHDSRRKVTFNEICENDTMKVDDIISVGKCGVISLDALNSFVKDNNLLFRYNIKNTNKRFYKNDKKDGNNEDNTKAGGPPRGARSHSNGPDTRSTEFKGDRGRGANRGRGGRGGRGRGRGGAVKYLVY